MEGRSPAKLKTTYIVLTVAFVVVAIGVSVYLGMTDPVSLATFLLLIGVLGFILFYFGFVKIGASDTELDVTYYTRPVPVASGTSYRHASRGSMFGAGSESPGWGLGSGFDMGFSRTASQGTEPGYKTEANSLPQSEVFYVSDNIFTYKDAPDVCKAYGAELASYSQIEQAYNSGAEWCGYGWSQDGLALFPTQQTTWDKMQKESDPSKKIECGRPGINGGYFDPMTKFGVNCFGPRPAKGQAPTPPKVTSDDKAIARFKNQIANFVISPFNQTEWSSITSSPAEMSVRAQPFERIQEDTEGIFATMGNMLSFVGSSITNLVGVE
jgi:hypothetical protein